jgi:magnesium transporter
VLRLTPGALSSQRLVQRPGSWPSHLYIHGGLAPTAIELLVFEPEGVQRHVAQDPQEILALCQQGHTLWLRIRGLADRPGITSLLGQLGIPPPLIAPLIEVPQRPQVDCLDAVIMVVLHRLGSTRVPGFLVSEQVGLLLINGLLITIEEGAPGDSFPGLTQWLLSNRAAPSDRDLDDILHFLIDEILDGLFPLLEGIAHELDELEEAVLRRPKPKLLNVVFKFRSNLRTIRSQVWPLRHQIKMLLRQNQNLLGKEALLGFQEMAEMVEMLFENCELLRSQCDAITQAYSASVGNRMNQVMKTLTILTSIFAPLTLIAGIYGMNFKNMPELSWHYGYFFALGTMLVTTGGLYLYFKRKGWL